MRKRGLGGIFLVAVVILGVGSRSARASDELFVVNNQGNSVTVYARTADGPATPLRTLAGAATGLNQPYGVAVDSVNNEIIVTNHGNSSITVYSRTAIGNTAPTRTITGAATGLESPHGLAFDPVHNEILVANFSVTTPTITVYDRLADGNALPLRTIVGAATGLHFPAALALDLVNNEVAISNAVFMTVTVYSRTATGNASPLRTITGPTTTLVGPIGLAIDAVNNELAVVSNGTPGVLVFSRTADGDVAPMRTLAGPTTGFSQPYGLVVDTVNNELVVSNSVGSSIVVFPRTATGDTAPTRTLSGAATGLQGPVLMAEAPGTSSGSSFYTVTPCRFLDTRGPAGPYGGPSLLAGDTRTFVLAGASTPCGIPATATAVAVNVVAIKPTDGPGFLTIYRGGRPRPPAPTINMNLGGIRANNAIVTLGAAGDVVVHCQLGTGSVDLILDVTGYYQ